MLFGASLFWAGLIPIKSFAGTPVKVVVIDAGHGGEDPGAIGGKGTQEKDITLKMALLLGEMIEKKYSDIKVIYTRKTDVFVKLHRRAEIANENRADLFISIHCNAADNKSVYGTETFVMGLDKANQNIAVAQKENASILLEKNYEENYGGFDPSSPESYIIFDLYRGLYLEQSIKFAAYIQDEFKNKLNRYCRGVKQALFLVLWRTTMPSVLIELGFISNKDEEAYICSEKGQQELVNAIFNAFSKRVEEAREVKNPAISKDDISVVASADTANFKAEVMYKVQFLSSSKLFQLNDPVFKNIPDVNIEKTGNMYKYTAGRCVTYIEVVALQTKIKEMGYSDAFIIAIKKDGSRISIQEAKTLENKNIEQ